MQVIGSAGQDYRYPFPEVPQAFHLPDERLADLQRVERVARSPTDGVELVQDQYRLLRACHSFKALDRRLGETKIMAELPGRVLRFLPVQANRKKDPILLAKLLS